MKTTKLLIASFLFLLIIISCQKESPQILPAKGLMQFNAYFSPLVQTKATTPFPSGNKATIIAYATGSNLSTASPSQGTPIEAIAVAAGELTTSTPLYLPKGSYDFYSVSANNSNSPGISFSGGTSAQLSNGTDYLWAKVSSVNEGGTVNFNFSHKAVGIEVNITPGSGLSGLNVTSIKITPSKADASSVMNLATGSIGTASSTEALTSMNVTANKGTIIMLPLSSQSIGIEVTIDATIGNTPVTSKVYTAEIPSQSYDSGTYYTLNLSVNATSLAFNGAQITDWTTQTISGVTLTEQ